MDRFRQRLQDAKRDFYVIRLVGIQRIVQEGDGLPWAQSYALFNGMYYPSIKFRSWIGLQGRE